MPDSAFRQPASSGLSSQGTTCLLEYQGALRSYTKRLLHSSQRSEVGMYSTSVSRSQETVLSSSQQLSCLHSTGVSVLFPLYMHGPESLVSKPIPSSLDTALMVVMPSYLNTFPRCRCSRPLFVLDLFGLAAFALACVAETCLGGLEREGRTLPALIKIRLRTVTTPLLLTFLDFLQ